MGDRIQYSVVLTEGCDAGLRRWVWVEKSDVELVVSDFNLTCDSFRKDDCEASLSDTGELQIVSPDERMANLFVNLLAIDPKPFIERNGKYIINRFGDRSVEKVVYTV